jgi:acetyltransferase-like isoleucine patch superfamily enzyme
MNKKFMMNLINEFYNRIAFARNDVEYETFPRIYGRILIIKQTKNGEIKLGKNLLFNSRFEANPIGGSRTVLWIVDENAVIEIDDNTALSNVIIASSSHIDIGKNVNIGGGTKIIDSDFHPLLYSQREKDDTKIHVNSLPVTIKDGVFIGADVIITKGVTIGEESVIGIRSVVTKDIPAGEIWAGNPARFIRKVNQ